MDFEAQGSVRLIVLMLAGAVFAGAGLWLLLRPKPAGGSARIELFGLKFESSSAGVLVFVIGAAFLALPLFVPEKSAMPAQDEGVDSGSDLSGTGADAVEKIGAAGNVALRLPPDPEVGESEPNDRIQRANQIGPGQTVSGEVFKGNDDWFVVSAASGGARLMDMQVRKVAGSSFSAALLDSREESIGARTVYGIESGYVRGQVLDNDRFYVRISSGSSAEYEVTLLPVRD
jgi:hypothetical protein